jgi:predicted nucleotidyltransferase
VYDADVEGLEERLRRALETREDVLVAYLFGSVARGRAGPLSDVDVAVLLAEHGDPFPRFLEVAEAVGCVVGPERADVVLLNTAPVALAYRVLRDGRLLVCRDERARVEHWVRTVLAYLDMEPFFRTFEEGLRHRILEGRFGRP